MTRTAPSRLALLLCTAISVPSTLASLAFDGSIVYSGDGTYYGQYGTVNTGGACALDYGSYAYSGGVPGGAYSGLLGTVAMNYNQYIDGTSQSCGACIQLLSAGSGSGAGPIMTPGIYLVNNECPECLYGSLDFGLNGDGRYHISWKFVQCPVTRSIGYTFQGSQAYYTKMQIRYHKVPIQSVSLQRIGGGYDQGTRTADNFWLWGSGSVTYSTPPQVKIVSVFGETLYDTLSGWSTSNWADVTGTGVQFNQAGGASSPVAAPVPSPVAAPVSSPVASPTSVQASIQISNAPTTVQRGASVQVTVSYTISSSKDILLDLVSGATWYTGTRTTVYSSGSSTTTITIPSNVPTGSLTFSAKLVPVGGDWTQEVAQVTSATSVSGRRNLKGGSGDSA